MKLSRTALAALAFVLPIAVGAAQQQGPPMPKPGPEHEILKMDVGTWDATVEMIPAPGAPPMTSKGVEVNTLGCGGLCIITDFKGELMPGVTFHGHGTMTWDAGKKKYVGSWTDSMSGGLSLTEGTWDAKTKKFNGWMEGPDMSGQVMKTRSVVDYSGGGRVMTAFAPGPDGKEMQVLKISYKKR
jgi:hypothetical protein